MLIAASGRAAVPQSVYKHRRFLHFVDDVGVMGHPSVPAIEPLSDDPSSLISPWCAACQASDSQMHRILVFLSLGHMLSLPPLPRTLRSLGIHDFL